MMASGAQSGTGSASGPATALSGIDVLKGILTNVIQMNQVLKSMAGTLMAPSARTVDKEDKAKDGVFKQLVKGVQSFGAATQRVVGKLSSLADSAFFGAAETFGEAINLIAANVGGFAVPTLAALGAAALAVMDIFQHHFGPQMGDMTTLVKTYVIPVFQAFVLGIDEVFKAFRTLQLAIGQVANAFSYLMGYLSKKEWKEDWDKDSQTVRDLWGVGKQSENAKQIQGDPLGAFADRFKQMNTSMQVNFAKKAGPLGQGGLEDVRRSLQQSALGTTDLQAQANKLAAANGEKLDKIAAGLGRLQPAVVKGRS
jgi:hypothetical protein